MSNLNELTTFFDDGFQIFDGVKYTNYFEKDFLDNLKWKDTTKEKEGRSRLVEYGCFYPEKSTELDILLYSIHQEIALDIVANTFKNYSVEKRTIWKNVNQYLCNWHTDAYEDQIMSVEENYYNAFFLLYFNDMEKIKEGSISFKKISTEQEWKIYPKPGTLIAISCDKDFLHKPEMTEHLRIVSSFWFNLIERK